MGIMDSLTQQVGPAKVWQWGVLGGSAVLIIMLFKGRGKAAAGPPLTVVPMLDFSSKSPPAGLTGGILDDLIHLVCMSPNAPNTVQLSTPDGSSLSYSNGVPTFGSAAGILTGQGGVQTPSQTWNPCKPVEAPATGGGGPTDPNPPTTLPTDIHWIGSGPGWLAYIPTPGGPGHWENVKDALNPFAAINWSTPIPYGNDNIVNAVP